MQKSDLKTGMLVALRNGSEYYVMLGARIDGITDLLVSRYEDHTLGHISLDDYDDDMHYHYNYPYGGDFLDKYHNPENDPQWDIVRVDSVSCAVELFARHNYKSIWQEEHPEELNLE